MTAKDTIAYQLIRQVFFLLGMLPRGMLNFFSDILGLVWYKIDKRHRTVALENIRTAYPGKFSPFETERLAKTIFKNIAGIPFEVLWFYGKPWKTLAPYFSVKNRGYFENAKKKGRGIIFVTCHLGNFELLPAAQQAAGIKNLHAIYRKFDFLPLERLMLEMRQRFGTVMIPTGGAARKIDNILHHGGVVATLFDQNAGWYNGVVTDFFGRPACSKNSLAKLVLKSSASVVPVFMVKKNARYVVEFLPEIPLQRTGCPIKDIEVNTQNYVTAVETMVRQCPEQYFWVHNRWKTQPFSPI